VEVLSRNDERMPALFLGHGNPMNAVEDNPYTAGWRAIGASIPRPRGIVCVSAHWYLEGTRVTAMERPRTIHDFGGFPRSLYEVRYPAPGDPLLAGRLSELLKPTDVIEDAESWGLDHGAWSVLIHVFPEADVPVVQLSLDETQPPQTHYELGQRLSPLREDGILILGSGNLVHNLHTYAWGRHGSEPFDWALRFEAEARRLLLSREHGPLVDYESMGPDAKLSVPTPEHYLPFLYVVAGCAGDEAISFPVQGVDGGSVSMLAVRIG
jgi:4,5-DOPA dioxygenase extradiol